MKTLPEFPIRYQRRPDLYEGFESVENIFRNMRGLHETRITCTFDHGLSMTLDALLEQEEGSR